MNFDKNMKELFIVPLKILSEANKIEHWSKKHKRRKAIKQTIGYLVKTKIKPPCLVILTRIAPRELDEEDNLRSALKWPRDCIADILIPGLQPGRADASKDIAWEFKQEKGKVREYALKIEIEEKT